MGRHDDLDTASDDICSAVDRMDGAMTALALNELPTDDYLEGGVNAASSEEEEEETPAQRGACKLCTIVSGEGKRNDSRPLSASCNATDSGKVPPCQAQLCLEGGLPPSPWA